MCLSEVLLRFACYSDNYLSQVDALMNVVNMSSKLALNPIST